MKKKIASSDYRPRLIFHKAGSETEYPIFRIFSKNDVNSYVFKEYLKTIRCHCGGKLHISSEHYTDYSRRIQIKMECQDCDGYYILESLLKDEEEELTSRPIKKERLDESNNSSKNSTQNHS